MNDKPKKDFTRIIVGGGHLILEALERGVRKAMLEHKKEGFPVVIERDGKIERLKPEDLGI